MRYVFYAIAMLVASVAWVNNTSQGNKIKQRLATTPEAPARLY